MKGETDCFPVLLITVFYPVHLLTKHSAHFFSLDHFKADSFFQTFELLQWSPIFIFWVQELATKIQSSYSHQIYFWLCHSIFKHDKNISLLGEWNLIPLECSQEHNLILISMAIKVLIITIQNPWLRENLSGKTIQLLVKTLDQILWCCWFLANTLVPFIKYREPLQFLCVVTIKGDKHDKYPINVSFCYFYLQAPFHVLCS